MHLTSTRSRIVDLARVLALISVTLRHSLHQAPSSTGDFPTEYLIKLYHFVGVGAVPLFFMLSGLLSAKKIDDPSYPAKRFVKNKFHSLVIPFLLWNGLLLLAVVILRSVPGFNQLSGEGSYFGLETSFSAMMNALIGIGRTPINYQLWFMRDLIVISLASIVICRKLPPIPLLPWILLLVPHSFFTSAGYYLMGYHFGHHLQSPTLPSKKSLVLYIICWLLLGLMKSFHFLEIPSPLHQLGSAFLILFSAKLLSYIRIGKWLSSLGPATFFLYASHEPTLSFLSRIWQISNLPRPTLAVFLLLPPVTLAICYLAYRVSWNLLPGLTRYLSGGRIPAFRNREPARGILTYFDNPLRSRNSSGHAVAHQTRPEPGGSLE